MPPYPMAMAEYPTVRQSILSEFSQCNLLAGMGRVLEEGWSTHPQARGTISHRVFSRSLMEMYEQEENRIEVDVAMAIFRECLRQHDVPPEDVVCLPTHEIKDIAWVVRKWATDNEFDIAALASVEERLEAIVRYPDPAGGWVDRRITGQLDVLFMDAAVEHAAVIDWKDTWALPGPTDLSFDGYFQQRMYGLLAMRKYHTLQSVTLRECYVRFSPGKKGEPGYPLNVREATVWRSDLEEIEAELSAYVEQWDRAVEHGVLPWEKPAKDIAKEMRAARRDAKAAADAGEDEACRVHMARFRALRHDYNNSVGLWRPSPGAHCASYCPRPQACPILPQARRAGRITDLESAERVAAETVAADAAAKQGKDALKVWVDKHGPVNVKDAKGPRQFAHIPQNKTRRVTKEMIEEEVTKAARERRAPDIEGLYQPYTGTRFGLYKPKPTVDGVEDPSEQSLIEQLEESVRQAQERKAEADAA